MTELHIISGGTGADTHIYTPEGKELKPISAEIHLGAQEFNTVTLTFVIPTIDVRAHLDQVMLICPACNSNMTHPCHPALPVVPDDAIYGD